jgi:hypothetical protein
VCRLVLREQMSLLSTSGSANGCGEQPVSHLTCQGAAPPAAPWPQGRQGTCNRRVRGCAPQAAPRNLRVFEGPYTRPARPPEAHIFLGVG